MLRFPATVLISRPTGSENYSDTLVEARRSLPLENCLDLVPLEAARMPAVCGTADEVGKQIHSVAQHATSICVKPPIWAIEPSEAQHQATLIEQLLFGQIGQLRRFVRELFH